MVRYDLHSGRPIPSELEGVDYITLNADGMVLFIDGEVHASWPLEQAILVAAAINNLTRELFRQLPPSPPMRGVQG